MMRSQRWIAQREDCCQWKQSRKDVIGIPWLFVGLTYGISWVLWMA